MKYIPSILLVCLLCAGINAIAQPKPPSKTPSINQTDVRGNRFGLWLLEYPAAMGEPAYTEWGRYSDNRKIGPWYKMDANGEVTSIENYKNDVRDGEVKYFDKGRLTCIGHYRGLNPDQVLDTIIVMDPVTGIQQLREVRSERGALRHGMWRFYDPTTGRMIREEEYQVDSLIYKKEFVMTSADSAFYKRREQNMPHNKGVKPGKSVSNLK